MEVLLGIKRGMARVFKGEKSVPVTVVEVSEPIISYKDTQGFELGLGKSNIKDKAILGKYKTLGYIPRFRHYFLGKCDMNVGDKLDVSSLSVGSLVEVVATTKGKGFAGVVKRYGFRGGPKTHGQSDRHRAPGSIGAGTTPGRVLKGKRMAGRMGSKQVTLKNKEIVDSIDNFVLISGPIPGSNGDKVVIKLQK